jgi:adenosine deaminase CECR1
MMFNVAKSHMESTKLFRIISKMPKGSLLHGHLGAMVDLEWVFNEAIETVGMCFSADVGLVSEVREGAGVKFEFSRSVKEGSGASIWGSDYEAGRRAPLKEAAETFPDGGRDGFVAWMKDRCSITQTESLQHHLGVDDVWRKLQGAFIIVTPIIYYEPIMRSFLRKFFTTLVEDGVRWVEIRTVFSTPFTLEGADGPTGSAIDLVRVLHEEIENFREGSGGKFWGARLIWTGMRFQSTDFLVKGKLRFPLFTIVPIFLLQLNG